MRYRLYFTYLIFGFVLVQYQNCAPSSEVLDAQASIEEPGLADGIDQVSVGQISFVEKQIVASPVDGQVNVLGLCDHSGALISWQLKNDQGNAVERGLSECSLGTFEVALSEDSCEQGELMLQAALGAKAHSEVSVACD